MSEVNSWGRGTFFLSSGWGWEWGGGGRGSLHVTESSLYTTGRPLINRWTSNVKWPSCLTGLFTIYNVRNGQEINRVVCSE